MKLDLNAAITNLEGVPMTDEKNVVATVRASLCNALLAVYADEERVSGEEKLKRWKFAQKLYTAKDTVEIKAEEIVLLKTLVAKAYTPMVSGQLWELLDK